MKTFLNFIRKYRTKRGRLLLFVAADLVFIFLAIWLAFLLRFDFAIPSQYLNSIWQVALLSAFFVVPIFYLHGLYTFSWSFVSTRELLSITRAVGLSFAFTALVIFLSKDFYAFEGFPRSVLLISYGLIFLFAGAIRISKKIYQSIFQGSFAGRERTLIVGAGDTGEQIARNMLSSANSPYFPVGFADDSQIKQKVSIHGVKVLGKLSQIPDIIKNHAITQLIVAMPSASAKVIQDIVELARQAGAKKIKIVPAFSEIIQGNISLENLKTVTAEGLLGRDSVHLDTREISALIKGNNILVTGAAGSIGAELSRQIARFSPARLSLLDQDETGIFNISGELAHAFPDIKIDSIVADITHKERVNHTFNMVQPAIVFHAAAYKHVPLMEENPHEAVKNNVLGKKILADECVKHGVKKCIFISTDKAVNPTSVMGATKRIGEMISQAHNQKGVTKFISVRFGNVLDSRGSVIPIFREQIRRGGPVEVTHPDMERYFMLNSEACTLVLQAGAMGQGGEVFVLDMGKPVKILDLAKTMIRFSGLELDKDIAIVFKGKRPGEKLFEEMLTAEEDTTATKHQKIFIARMGTPNARFIEKIEELERILIQLNTEDLISQLKEIVPTFRAR